MNCGMRRSEVPFAAEAVNDTSVSGIRNQFGLSGTSGRLSSMQTQQPCLGQVVGSSPFGCIP